MKNSRRILLLTVLIFTGLLSYQSLFADITFQPITDTTAYVGIEYTYDVNVTASPADVSFSKVSGPTGLSINSSTGIVTWPSPTNIQNNRVTIRATNAGGTFSRDKTFYIYVTDAYPCSEDLKAYWKLDETNGPNYYDFISNYNAQANTSPVDTTGMISKAKTFTPPAIDTRFLTVNDGNQFEWGKTDSFSIVFWFNSKGNIHDRDQVVVGRGELGLAHIIVGFDGYNSPTALRPKVRLINKSGSVADCIYDFNIPNNEWHHFAFVYEGDNGGAGNESHLKLYYDGVLRADSTFDFEVAGLGFDAAAPLNIGFLSTYYPANTYPFAGKLDEILIYDAGLTASEIAEIHTEGSNHTPQCKSGNYTPVVRSTEITNIDEDADYSYTIVTSDIEGSGCTVSTVSLPSWLTRNTKTLSGIPLNQHVGPANVQLNVTDGTATIPYNYSITVSNTNDDPVVTSSALTAIDEDALYSYTLTASDDDIIHGDGLTYSVVTTLPGWLDFNTGTHLLSGYPTQEYMGTNPTVNFNVTLRVTDESLQYDEENITITVTNINDAPDLTGNVPISIEEDTYYEIDIDNIEFTDGDNIYPDDYTLTVDNTPGDNYTVAGNIVTPELNYYGTLSIPINLSDGELSDDGIFQITVTSVNDAPEFSSTPNTIAYTNTIYTYILEATDVENNTLTFLPERIPDWLDLETSGILTGAPSSGDIGQHAVVINLTDNYDTVYQAFILNVQLGTNIDDNNYSLTQSIYPVPANDEIYLKFRDEYKDITVQIFDLSGKELIRMENINKNELKIDIGDIPSNIYMIKIFTNDKVEINKFIKE